MGFTHDDEDELPGEIAFERAQRILESVSADAFPTPRPIQQHAASPRQHMSDDEDSIPAGVPLNDLTSGPTFDLVDDHASDPAMQVVKQQQQAPLRRAGGSVDLDFASLGAPSGLQLLTEYVRASHGYFLQETNANTIMDPRNRGVVDKVAETLHDERNTWQLVYVLHDAMQGELDGDEYFDDEPVNHAKTEQLAVDVAYRRDYANLQLLHRVTKWLHATAEEECYQATPGSERSRAEYWPRTVGALVTGSSWVNKDKMVKYVDPDAPDRDGRKLHPEDEDDDVKLLRRLWHLVRAGSHFQCYSLDSTEDVQGDANHPTNRAEQLCETYGQYWRAASMRGGSLVSCSKDPQTNELTRDGNVYKLVWKEMCMKLALKAQGYEHRAIGELERAVYSALAGDVEALVASQYCPRWVDHCWAYFRSMVQARVDYLCIVHRNKCLEITPDVPGPELKEYEDRHIERIRPLMDMDAAQVFDLLAASPNTAVRETAAEFFPSVQASLIQGTFNELLVEQICPFLCGENWHQMGYSVLRTVCGDDFVADYGCDGDRVALGNGLEEERQAGQDVVSIPPPCWNGGLNNAIVPHLLRFTTHLVTYLSNGGADHQGVVKERRPVDPVAHTACIVSYVLYLLSEKQFEAAIQIFDRLPELLSQAIMSCMFEGLALATNDVKTAFLDLVGKSVVEESSMREFLVVATRNVRRRWLQATPTPFIVQTASIVDESSLHLSESQRPQGAAEALWNRLWNMFQTWRWFLAVDTTVLEAVHQANTIIRELIFLHESQCCVSGQQGIFGLDDDRDETQVGETVDMSYWAAAVLFVTAIPEEVSDQQLPVNGLDRDNILRELGAWRAYFSLWRLFMDWKQVVGDIVSDIDVSQKQVEESRHKVTTFPKLVDEHRKLVDRCMGRLSAVTADTVSSFQQLLHLPSGWLNDDTSTESHTLVRDDPAIEREQARRRQLMGTSDEPGELKKLCLWPITMAYHHVLYTTGEIFTRYATQSESKGSNRDQGIRFYQESLCVANEVTVEDSSVYKCLSKKNAKALLEAFRKSAVTLLKHQHVVAVTDDE